MKFSIKPLLFCLVFAQIFISACKEEEKSTEELLTTTSCWSQVKAELFSTGTNNWLELPVPECVQDNCIQFDNDGTVVFDEGQVKCDSSNAEITTGTWLLGSDGIVATFTKGNIPLTYIIIDLSESKMVVEIDFFGSLNRATYEAK